MKKIAMIICLFPALWFASLCSSAPLDAQHRDCVTCHDTKTPAKGSVVMTESCTKCHGSYDELAKKTKDVLPNPHYNHLGEVRCSDCHRGHQEAKNMCNDCHQFNYKLP